MKSLGPEVSFTTFALTFKGVESGFDHVSIIPDSQLQDVMAHPLLVPYAKDVLSSFTRIDDLETSTPGTIVLGTGGKEAILRSGSIIG
jgi:hypothetical protein